MALRFLNSGYFAGSVGIGTDSPGQKLDVSGNIASNSIYLYDSTSNDRLVLDLDGSDNLQISTGTSTGSRGITFFTENSEKIRILSGGNVGIGTASPDNLLTIESSGDTILQINRNDNTIGGGNRTGIIQFGAKGTWGTNLATSKIWSYAEETFTSTANGTSLRFFTTELGAATPDEKMIIDTNGNVGIGTDSPGAKLTIKGSNSLNAFKITDSGDGDGFKVTSHTTQGTYVQVYNAAHTQTIMLDARSDSTARHTYFNGGGNVGIGATGPNAKLEVSYTNTGIGAIVGNTTHNSQLQIYTAAAGKNSEIWFGDAGDADVGKIDYDHANDSMSFFIGATKRLSFDSAGTMLLGDTTTAYQTIFFDPTPSTVYGNGTLQIQPTTSPGSGVAQFTTNFADRVGSGTTKHNVRVGGTVTATNFIGGSGAYLPLAGGRMTTTSKIEFYNASQYIYANSTNDLTIASGDDINFQTNYARFFNAGVESARISATTNSWLANGSNAKLGINRTDPSYTLDVNGIIRSENSSEVGTLYLGNTAQSQIPGGAIIGQRSPNYSSTGNLLFQVPTWGANTDYGLTTQMSIEVTGADTKEATISMIPFGGDVLITAALLSNQENTDVDTGTETVASVAIATYTAAFFDFVIKKTTNVRSGTVYACHDGTNVEFTETSTQDLGDTSDVTLSVDISGGNMRLRATTTSDDWSVKSLIRAI